MGWTNKWINWIEKISDYQFHKKEEQNLPLPIKTMKRYIFFPWQGLFHFVALSIIAAFAINYNNNLAIICACFLFTHFVLAIFQNHFAMRKLTLMGVKQVVHDEDQMGYVEFQFHYPAQRIYPEFWLKIDGVHHPLIFDDTIAKVRWNYGYASSGLFYFPKVTVFTLWPYAITRTWVDIKLKYKLAVLPGPQHNHSDSDGEQEKQQDQKNTSSTEGDVSGIRAVNQNEVVAKIAWKQSIKRDKMMTFLWEKSSNNAIEIRWDSEHADIWQQTQEVRSIIKEIVKQKKVYTIVCKNKNTPIYGTEEGGLLFLYDQVKNQDKNYKKWTSLLIKDKKEALI